MDLDEALGFAQKKITEGHKSDGCTYSPDLGIRRYCVMHDMLRRFSPVSSFEADNLFFKGIMTKGWKYFLVAALYWIVVRLQYYIGFPGIFGLLFVGSFVTFAYWHSGG